MCVCMHVCVYVYVRRCLGRALERACMAHLRCCSERSVKWDVSACLIKQRLCGWTISVSVSAPSACKKDTRTACS